MLIDFRLMGNIKLKNEPGVAGITWFENKIYLICYRSRKIRVFSDRVPFDELESEEMELKELIEPLGMVSSSIGRALFIGEMGRIWKIQIPGNEISSWDVDGRPVGLSITSSNQLLVTFQLLKKHENQQIPEDVPKRSSFTSTIMSYISSLVLYPLVQYSTKPSAHNADTVEEYFYFLAFYLSDGTRIKLVCLPKETKEVSHAVQLSATSVIISYSNKTSPSVFLISELSVDEGYVIRTFDLRLVETIQLKNWWPFNLSIDVENKQIFVADFLHSRIFFLSSHLNESQMILNEEQIEDDRPVRLCYVPERRELIVGHGLWLAGSVSVFQLRSVNMNIGDGFAANN